MRVTVIHHTEQVAIKTYHDDGAEYIQDWINGGLFVEQDYREKNRRKVSFAEKRILVWVRNNPTQYKIKKGERYVRQFNSYEGQTYTFRMNAETFKLACKYNLWPEL